MKRIYFLLIGILIANFSNAQNITDALRYSTDNLHGTARYSAMSGAFGALGGDLTGMQINPAGSAVFLNSTVNISLSLLDKKNETNYFNTENSNYNSDVTINQAGAVFVFNNPNEESVWKKFTLGLNYDVTNNFDDAYFATGQSNISIDSYFLNYAEGVPLDLLQLQSGESISDLYRFLGETQGYGVQQAFLGFQSFIIDPVDFDDPNNTSYVSNVAPGSFNQEYYLQSAGYNAKFTINLATQIQDNLYIGLNLNSHVIDYRESKFYFEENDNPDSFVNEIGFRNNLGVLGDGFSAQVGVISKPSEFIRLGLTYETPTWYNINEETTQAIETQRVENDELITETIRPNIINIYEEYQLRTPGKVTGSFAYLFGQSGLISVDYSYKDYSNIEFRPVSVPSFASENNRMNNLLKGVSTINIGGEYRWNKVSFRGGYKYEDSPYSNKDLMSELTGFSLGLGYNFGSFKLDAAYARTEQDRQEQFFPNSGFTNATNISSVNNFFTITANFGF